MKRTPSRAILHRRVSIPPNPPSQPLIAVSSARTGQGTDRPKLPLDAQPGAAFAALYCGGVTPLNAYWLCESAGAVLASQHPQGRARNRHEPATMMPMGIKAGGPARRCVPIFMVEIASIGGGRPSPRCLVGVRCGAGRCPGDCDIVTRALDIVDAPGHDEAMDVRQLVSDAIRRRGLSQQDVASLAGLSQSQVSRYLSGERDLMGRSLEALMGVLGLEVRARGQGRPGAGQWARENTW